MKPSIALDGVQELLSPTLSRFGLALLLIATTALVSYPARKPTLKSGQSDQEKRGLGVPPSNKSEPITSASTDTKPELVLQTGHSDRVLALDFSPDGRLLASGSDDQTVRFWEVATGRELRNLALHKDSVTKVVFSPDGRLLASGGDKSINLYDVDTGRVVHTLTGHQHRISAIAFSNDGRFLASAENDASININVSLWSSNIKVWEVKSGREIRSGHIENTINDLAFSRDGRRLVLAHGGEALTVWDIKNSREVEPLQLGPIRVLSRDGSRGANWSDKDGTCTIWELPGGRSVRTQGAHSIGVVVRLTSGELRIISEEEAQKTLKKLESKGPTFLGRKIGIQRAVLSPDGRLLASAGGDQSIKIWDATTGRELRTLPSGLSNTYIDSALAFSSDGRRLAAGGGISGGIETWDLTTGRRTTLGGQISQVTRVAFSPNGRLLASGDVEAKINIWELAGGRQIKTLFHRWVPHMFDRYGVNSIAFSPEGNLMASSLFLHGGVSADENSAIRLWDVGTGSELSTFVGGLRTDSTLAFSEDGRRLSSTNNFMTNIWDITSGRKVVSLPEENGGGATAFSPDLRLVARFDRWTKLFELREADTGRALRKLNFGPITPSLMNMVFSPDGQKLAFKSPDKDEVWIWDVATDRRLCSIAYLGGSFAFSSDSRRLASPVGRRVTICESDTGRELLTLVGHTELINSVAFSPDGRTLVTGSRDGTSRLWDSQNGSLLATLFSLGKLDGWLAVTPDGLFDGSPAAWTSILWRFAGKTFDVAPVESFFNEFYYPGLLADLFAGKRPKAAQKISELDRRQPEIKIMLADSQTSAGGSVSARNVAVRIEVAEAPADRGHPIGSGARDVRLFRNGSLVKVWRGDVLKDKTDKIVLETSVPIVAGENRLTGYAFNRDNIKSTDATLTVNGADSLKRKGVGYVLAVGVNEYANTQYNLKYAVADAQDFADELKRQQSRLSNYERVEVISLNDKDATKANILNSLADLSAKVQPEDALVIFFAGHGTAQQNRFYLIPHDLGYAGSRTALDSTGLQNILAHSVSDEEISRAVEGIDAGQMLLVIDACNSGQALEAEEKRRGPMNSKGLAQLAYEKGMYILTAAQSYQAANEAERYGHGFLTYALVEEGLKTNAADKEPKDGQVLLREWLDFATERVPQMQQDKLDDQKKQGRQLDRIKFAETDSGNERSIQRPRVFYRRETELRPLVVARP